MLQITEEKLKRMKAQLKSRRNKIQRLEKVLIKVYMAYPQTRKYILSNQIKEV